jgi:hypothetical protein
MIQLIFDSVGQLIPEWDNEQERLVFRLSAARVSRSQLLRGCLEEAGASIPDGQALGLVATRYEGDLAREVRVILELPDEAWDGLANRADELLDES